MSTTTVLEHYAIELPYHVPRLISERMLSALHQITPARACLHSPENDQSGSSISLPAAVTVLASKYAPMS